MKVLLGSYSFLNLGSYSNLDRDSDLDLDLDSNLDLDSDETPQIIEELDPTYRLLRYFEPSETRSDPLPKGCVHVIAVLPDPGEFSHLDVP